MIFICTFSSNIFGYGRYNRSKFLYSYLKKKKFQVKLNHNINLNNITIKKNSIYFFDLPFKADTILEKLFKINKHIFLLDYYGKFKLAKNFLIYDHQKVSSNKKYIGLKYSIINPNIKKIKNNSDIKTINNKILISIGGADIKNQTYQIAFILSKLGYDLTIVLGPLSKQKKIDLPRTKVFNNPKNFMKILNSHKYIFCNGGTTLIESLILNKSVFAVPQNSHEFKFCKYLYKKKMIYDYRKSKLYKKSIINFKQFKLSKKLCINGLNEIYNETLLKI